MFPDNEMDYMNADLFKVGDEVTNYIVLGLGGNRKVKVGRKGKVLAIYQYPGKMPRLFVEFGPKTKGLWPQNVFRPVED